MSKYNRTHNDHEVECPYCGNKYQSEPEDYTEDEQQEQCDECGKKYYLYHAFSVDHETVPDCVLNGGQHDYQPLVLRDGRRHPFCSVCGKCQPHQEQTEDM